MYIIIILLWINMTKFKLYEYVCFYVVPKKNVYIEMYYEEHQKLLRYKCINAACQNRQMAGNSADQNQ